MGGQLAWRFQARPHADQVAYEDIAANPEDLARSIRYMTTPAPDSAEFIRQFQLLDHEAGPDLPRNDLKDYLEKMQNFESAHADDVFLDQSLYPTLISTFKRLDRVQNLVGYGNFNVLSFDDMLKYSRTYDSVGEFSQEETDFLDHQFSVDATEYGFLGAKVTTHLTAVIPDSEIVKMPHTGHFLYKGDSVRLYKKVTDAVGPSLVLTSGIRGIVKQMHLFLAKTIQAKGNLSRASRSLAPPGHSYHGVGDFDVGKIGYGLRNFTSDFARTDEYKALLDLGYVTMRYPQYNLLGVRYEPWHIKVV